MSLNERDNRVIHSMNNAGRPAHEFLGLGPKPETALDRVRENLSAPLPRMAFNTLIGKAIVGTALVGLAAVLSPMVNSDADARAAAPQGVTVKDTSYSAFTCFTSGKPKPTGRSQYFGRTFTGQDAQGNAVEGRVCRSLWGGTSVAVKTAPKPSGSF